MAAAPCLHAGCLAPVEAGSAPLLIGRQAYRDRDEPDTMTSTRGWGLLTGQIVDRLASTSCDSRRPVDASRTSIGCSATPPKSSEMYLRTRHQSLHR